MEVPKRKYSAAVNIRKSIRTDLLFTGEIHAKYDHHLSLFLCVCVFARALHTWEIEWQSSWLERKLTEKLKFHWPVAYRHTNQPTGQPAEKSRKIPLITLDDI